MSTSEFDIIRQYFTRARAGRADVVLGIGDDAALLTVPPGAELVVGIDTLVAGVHFSTATAAAAIGHKALAVNLSDLAAMGAEPAWATLALTLPENDPVWLEQFADAFFALADRYAVQLVGGDTTQGPLTVTVQAHGFVSRGQAVCRRGAQPGDRVYVTGTLGDAGLALQLGESAPASLQRRLDYPEPRIEAGLLMRKHASAAIDISDGLLADLGHLLAADALGAVVQVDALPRSADFVTAMQQSGAAQEARFHDLALSAGDDYELCITVPEPHCAALEASLGALSCGCTCIGSIEAAPGIVCYRDGGARYQPASTGYRHFSGAGHD
ncbi:MAG: thiamine-phosphate kinase [Gammaproteobacteria bacterium]